MEWTPGPSEASRLMRVLHRKDVHNLSTLTKPDGSSTCPGEETADLLFHPQSTPIHLPHYNHASSPTRYEGLDKWLRCQASVLEVHGSNPAMTWLKITSLLSLPYRR